MISALSSGGGKTVLSCGLMRAFARRGLAVRAYKCGPDYIDPMFHSRVLGVPSRNLDLFLQGEDGVRQTLGRGAGDLAILEGAMGFYDGVGGTDRASAWEVARLTETPVILALRPGGQSLTLAAQVRGLMEFRRPSQISGLILTDCKPALYDHLRPILEGETGLPVLGFLPSMEEARLESRHLGLVTPEELGDLSARFDRIGAALEAHVDLDRLLSLGAEGDSAPEPPEKPPVRCRIAVARDEAFCFFYPDNLEALEAQGAELVYFSPIRDRVLPEAEGLYLPGGYPELYLPELSANAGLRERIRAVVEEGMPTVAECGGFLYLQTLLRNKEGWAYPMAGVLPGTGYPAGGLRRFGYLYLRPEKDSLLFRAGERIPAHEFHHWDSTACGTDLEAEKPDGRRWRCGYAGPRLYGAFPHLHWGRGEMAGRFVAAAEAYGREQYHG